MRVDRRVQLGVVQLDVVKVGGLVERRVAPVQLAHPLVDVGVLVADHPDVALEVLHVDGVEPDDGGEQPHVGFSESVTSKVLLPVGVAIIENGFNPVQVLKHIGTLLVVHLLSGGEPGLVHPIVDVVVDPAVELVDLLLQVLGVQVDLLVFVVDQVVESGVENTDDFQRLVVDDGLFLFIPKHRDGETTTVVGVSLKVELPNTVQVVQVVLSTEEVAFLFRKLFGSGKSPPLAVHVPVDDGQADDPRQTLENTSDQSSVGPGTSVRHVQVVAACFRGETAAFFDGVTEAQRQPLVRPVVASKLEDILLDLNS